jgi:hypothetical protein
VERNSFRFHLQRNEFRSTTVAQRCQQKTLPGADARAGRSEDRTTSRWHQFARGYALPGALRLATIVRQERSQSRSVLAAAVISSESNLPTSAAVALQASAQAEHECIISGLCLAIMHADRPQKPAQSDARWSAFACSLAGGKGMPTAGGPVVAFKNKGIDGRSEPT